MVFDFYINSNPNRMWFFSIRNSKGVNSFPYLNRINLGDVAATHQTLIFPIFNLILKWLKIIYTNLMCLFVLQILLRVKSKFLILINLKTRSSQTKWHFIFFYKYCEELTCNTFICSDNIPGGSRADPFPEHPAIKKIKMFTISILQNWVVRAHSSLTNKRSRSSELNVHWPTVHEILEVRTHWWDLEGQSLRVINLQEILLVRVLWSLTYKRSCWSELSGI